MCGRAILTSPAERIAELFEVPPVDIGPARFNVAPTQPIVCVRLTREEAHKTRELAVVRWGLIPWWAKDEEAKRIGSRCVQARAETVRRSPAFRDAFKRHRCLVVFDGFYEWRGEKKDRVPFLARKKTGEPLAIAGLWDRWQETESAAVLTIDSGGAMQAIHDRMPLLLPPSEWGTWLAGTEEEAAKLLRPSLGSVAERGNGLEIVQVSKWVNDHRHEDSRCIERAPSDTAS